jgi:hypothetical protein
MTRAQETATFVVDDLTKIADKKIEHDPQKEEFLLEKKDLEPEREKSYFEELFGRNENNNVAEKETAGEPERELIKERDREAEM